MTEVLTYEALKAERDALAVENAALNEMNSSLCAELREYESDDCQFGPMPQSVVNCFALHTPATDAALAAIQAQGVEKAAAKLYGSGYVFEVLMRYSAELREAK